MENTIVYLTGYPGVGKYSIAREIERQAGARVVDNHLIANPVFVVSDVDGKTSVQPAVWAKIAVIRRAVFEAMAELGPPGVSYVLTNVLLDDAADAAVFEEVRAVALQRSASFLPVVLICDLDEHVRRLVTLSRAERMKWRDADGLRAMVRDRALFTIAHPNAFDLDVTALAPAEAAVLIVARAETLVPGN